MTFQVRHPLVENQFCSFDDQSSETFPIAAGTLVYATGETSDSRVLVDVVSDASAQANLILGFLMQKVREESTELPPGHRFRSDMGSSDAIIYSGPVPVGVASGKGAVYEIDQYVDNGADGITAGTVLYADDDGKLEDTQTDSGPAAAVALNTLTAAEVTAGKMLRILSLI